MQFCLNRKEVFDMVKMVVFDLDGTLADTSPGILNSIRYAKK